MLKRIVLSGVALIGLCFAGASVASADHWYYGRYCDGIYLPYSTYRPYVPPYPPVYVAPYVNYGYVGYGYGYGYPSYYRSYRYPYPPYPYRSGVAVGVGGVSVYLGR